MCTRPLPCSTDGLNVKVLPTVPQATTTPTPPAKNLPLVAFTTSTNRRHFLENNPPTDNATSIQALTGVQCLPLPQPLPTRLPTTPSTTIVNEDEVSSARTAASPIYVTSIVGTHSGSRVTKISTSFSLDNEQDNELDFALLLAKKKSLQGQSKTPSLATTHVMNGLLYTLFRLVGFFYLLTVQFVSASQLPGCDVSEVLGQGVLYKPASSGPYTLNSNRLVTQGCRAPSGTYTLMGRPATNVSRPVVTTSGTRTGNLFACSGTATCTIKGIEITNHNSVGNWGMLQVWKVNSDSNSQYIGQPTMIFEDIKISDSLGISSDGGSKSYANFLISLIELNPRSAFPTSGGLIIRGSIFSNTKAGGYGGFVYVDANILHVSDSIFHGNQSPDIVNSAIQLRTAKATIIRSTFTSNQMASATIAGGGGALHISGDSDVWIELCLFSHNTVNGKAGGAIHADGALTNTTIVDSNFEYNDAWRGGAVAASNGAHVVFRNITMIVSLLLECSLLFKQCYWQIFDPSFLSSLFFNLAQHSNGYGRCSFSKKFDSNVRCTGIQCCFSGSQYSSR